MTPSESAPVSAPATPDMLIATAMIGHTGLRSATSDAVIESMRSAMASESGRRDWCRMALWASSQSWSESLWFLCLARVRDDVPDHYRLTVARYLAESVADHFARIRPEIGRSDDLAVWERCYLTELSRFAPEHVIQANESIEARRVEGRPGAFWVDPDYQFIMRATAIMVGAVWDREVFPAMRLDTLHHKTAAITGRGNARRLYLALSKDAQVDRSGAIVRDGETLGRLAAPAVPTVHQDDARAILDAANGAAHRVPIFRIISQLAYEAFVRWHILGAKGNDASTITASLTELMGRPLIRANAQDSEARRQYHEAVEYLQWLRLDGWKGAVINPVAKGSYGRGPIRFTMGGPFRPDWYRSSKDDPWMVPMITRYPKLVGGEITHAAQYRAAGLLMLWMHEHAEELAEQGTVAWRKVDMVRIADDAGLTEKHFRAVIDDGWNREHSDAPRFINLNSGRLSLAPGYQSEQRLIVEAGELSARGRAAIRNRHGRRPR